MTMQGRDQARSDSEASRFQRMRRSLGSLVDRDAKNEKWGHGYTDVRMMWGREGQDVWRDEEGEGEALKDRCSESEEGVRRTARKGGSLGGVSIRSMDDW